MTCGVHRLCAEEAPERCPWCEINVLRAEVERVAAGWSAQMSAPCPVCAPVSAEEERLRFALAAICFLDPNTAQGNMAAAALAGSPT